MSQIFILLIFVLVYTDAGNGNSTHTKRYIRCYDCQGGVCDVIRSNTNWIKCPKACCILATSYGPSGLINMRKCSLASGNCGTKCEIFKKNYGESHPAQKVVSCESCDSDLCNSQSFEQTVKCYKCKNCNKVFAETPTVQCPSYKCCYMIWVAENNQQQYSVERGCMKWQPGDDCSDVCERTKVDHLRAYPEGGYSACKPCKADEPKCNRATYKPLPPINCLICQGKSCYRNATSYPKTRCVTECCLSAATFGKGGWNYYRKCAASRKHCKAHCDVFKRGLGKDEEVVSCRTCATNNCNNQPMVEPFKCYSCKNCRSVSISTHSVECKGPECCYTGYVGDVKTKPLFAVRGCGVWSKKCTQSEACRSLKSTRQQLIPHGKFEGCKTCKAGSPSGCNKEVYDPPSIKCYNCQGDECGKVNEKTPATKCLNLCCLSLTNFGKTGLTNVRKCADLMMPCEEYCTHYVNKLHKKSSREENLYCKACNGNNCNKEPLRGKLKCYECRHCNHITKTTKTVECKSLGCCYTAFLRDIPDEPLFAVRGCSKWRTGLRCTQSETCATFKNDHIKLHPHGHVDGCRTCKTENALGCNRYPYEPPLMCYSCEGDCTKVTNKTITIKCPGNCCYSASTFGVLGFTNVRKCADIKIPCNEYCKYHTDHVQEETQKELMFCRSCNSFRCNKEPLRAPFKCYECRNCNTIGADTPLIDCYGPRCCYTAYVKDNVYDRPFAIRGCATGHSTTGNWKCDSTCKDFSKEHQAMFPQETLEKCMVCDDEDKSGCNRATYNPLPTCYSCEGYNCNDIENNVTKIVCSKQCCMAATIFHEAGMINVRKCAEPPCGDFCAKYTQYNALKLPNSEMLYCHTCEQYQCNKEVLAVPFKCYECRRCPLVNKETVSVDCRYPDCCYTAYVKETDEEEFFAVRGCFKGKCADTCAEIERLHFLAHPDGDFESCVTCTEGSSNNASSSKTRFSAAVNIGSNSIMCYKCTHCSRVTSDTPTIRCQEDRCCFRAAVKDDEDSDFYVIRGCAHLKRTQTCENTCDYITHKHLLGHPKGSVHACIRCVEGDADNCNDVIFNLAHIATRKTMQPIMCYECRRNCDKVVAITPNVQCSSAKCCYTAYVTDGPDDDQFFAVRGCAMWKPGGLCDNTCKDVEREHLENHPQGKFGSCLTCQDGDPNECNSQPYEYTLMTQKKSINQVRCYSCRNCNEVTASTSTVDCPSAKCCYRAIIKNHATEPFFAVRGCARLKHDQVCDNTCQYVKENHLQSHPSGEFGACLRCKEGDTHKCNDIKFNLPDTNAKPTYMMCYDCRNCSRISVDIPSVACRAPGCCYTAYLSDHSEKPSYTVRGCAKWGHEKTCINTCATIKNEHLWAHPLGVFTKCLPCVAGDGDNCNAHLFDSLLPGTTSIRKSAVQNLCYDCRNCSVITYDTPTTFCPRTKCCYSAYAKNTDVGEFYVVRGCARLVDEMTCEDSCEEARNEHFWLHPYGTFGQCMACDEADGDKCNKHFIGQDQVLYKSLLPSAMCYECTSCSTVTSLTHRVPCSSPKCCYTSLLRDKVEDGIYVVRGCIEGGNCTNTCQVAKAEYIAQIPDGHVEYCVSCGEHEGVGCNNNNYSPQTSSTTTVTSRKSSAGSGMCYECRNCNKVTPTTPTVYCPYIKCCYTALLKDLPQDDTFAVRGCIQQEEECSSACETLRNYHALAHPDGTINFCVNCDDDDPSKCNKHEYTAQLFQPQVPKRKFSPISCFDCTGCFTIYDNTTLQLCPENCCFTVVWTEFGITTAARLCAQHNGTSCGDYCEYTRATIIANDDKAELRHCETCSSEKCNRNPITPVQHVVETMCYQCKNCGVVNKKTPRTKCFSNCCFATQEFHNGDMVINRDCARVVPGRPCHQFCQSFKSGYCNTCNTDNCNSLDLTNPVTTPKYQPPISCYHTVGFKEVSVETITALCPDRCCYTVVWYEHNEAQHARLCAELDGKPCEKYCLDVRHAVHVKDPYGTVQYCKVCRTDRCNNEKLETPTALVAHPQLVNCYSCDGCNEVSSKTPTVPCPSECCYSVNLRGEGMQRRCAKIMPGRTCSRYCLHVENTGAGKVALGECEICTTDLCNSRAIASNATVPKK